MLSVLCKKREGYAFYYELSDGQGVYGGGMKDGELVCDAACMQKELMLRTLVNKCMNDFVKSVRTRDIWDTDLLRFGFELQDGYYVAGYEKLRLPHDCGH